MVSIQRPSRAEQVASNVRGSADGGCISADAPNAATLAVVTVHQISMLRNTAPLQVTRLLRASSQASGGFTTIVQRNSSPARSFPLLTHVRWISRCPDQPDGCLQTGKRCFTNRGGWGDRIGAPAASWCDPAGASPAQVRSSVRLVASVAWPLATTVAKRTQRLRGVWD